TGGSRAEAEDLTQETFLAAYSSRSDFAGINPLAWLFGVARRRQRDAFRAASVRPATVPVESTEIMDATQPVSETVTRRIVLQTTLDTLDAPERDAILLVIVQGLTYAEAAIITQEPVGTVKWRVHSGTKRLRFLLSGTFAEESNTQTARKDNVSHAEIEHTKTATV
ncbi:MAG: RNA polymerase sigma factor, partial [Fibrella sp.]|nr:RNA polymerase sigma factor [Armatimonadota bacterium]